MNLARSLVPVLTHVPPISARSTITTFNRLRRAWIAAENAALPPPTIAKSYFIDASLRPTG